MKSVDQAPVSRSERAGMTVLIEAAVAAELDAEQHGYRQRRRRRPERATEVMRRRRHLGQHDIAQVRKLDAAAETLSGWLAAGHLLVTQRGRHSAKAPAERFRPLRQRVLMLLQFDGDNLDPCHARLMPN